MNNKNDLEPINNILENVELFGKTDEFMEFAIQFRQLMMVYESGIKEISTKLDILNNEFKSRHKRNPIDSIKSRVKEPMSILEKLKKKKLPISINSISENINDIAGIRVICPFISDIYYVADMLMAQDDIIVVEIKDYIKNPKENGYRSLHLVLRVGVYFSEKKSNVLVELQIRTIAMDFWASIDHQIRYKKKDKCPKDIESEMKFCAETIAEIDEHMQSIVVRMEE